MAQFKIPGLDLPAHSIFCIGRNYAEHAKEMGHLPPSEPIVFLKPISALCKDGSQIQLPTQSNDVHHEVELVLVIGKSGKNIPESEAWDHITGYGIGIDFTARDLQKIAKEKGQPWSIAKGFDQFAPISECIKLESGDSIEDLDLKITVDGEIRQSGNTRDMIFSIPKLVSYLSGIFTLNEGDLIFTGTPEGVSAVQPGNKIEATLGNDLAKLTVSIS